jgi:hypothetical protein
MAASQPAPPSHAEQQNSAISSTPEPDHTAQDDACSPIIVRPATDADAQAIRDVIVPIWIDEFNFKVDDSNYPDLFAIEDSYTKKGAVFLVAEVCPGAAAE